MTIQEMKGCPWCGCKPSTVSVSADCWQTYCANWECLAEVSVMGLTSEKSMRIWNEMAAGKQPEAAPNAEAIVSSAGARGSASPSPLEYCCMQILNRKFWCDVSHDHQQIFEILAEKKLMDCNDHGQMVEVMPNNKLRDGGPTTPESK